MSILNKYITLTHELCLIVPSTININEDYDNTEEVKKCLEVFSKIAGGASIYEGFGAWYSEELEKLITEEHKKVIVFYNDKIADDIEKAAEALGLWMCKKMNQEAIMFIRDHQAGFITQ